MLRAALRPLGREGSVASCPSAFAGLSRPDRFRNRSLFTVKKLWEKEKRKISACSEKVAFGIYVLSKIEVKKEI